MRGEASPWGEVLLLMRSQSGIRALYPLYIRGFVSAEHPVDEQADEVRPVRADVAMEDEGVVVFVREDLEDFLQGNAVFQFLRQPKGTT